MAALAAGRSVELRPFYETLGTTPELLESPETRLDFEGFAHAWAWLAEAAGDGVPFALAKMLRVEAYDVMGFASMTAYTAREAFERVCRYQRLFTDGGSFALETPKGADARLLWLREGPPEQLDNKPPPGPQIP